ncbi:MAG: triose-phosphate isomerase, partial [Zetaproteobacteria bacterium]
MQYKMLVAGNWKMHGLLSEALRFVEELIENPDPEHLEVALMPPFTLLYPLA